MKIAVLSDIHSNLEALKAVDRAMDELGAEMVYFVGDVVGYGPDPNECTRWVMERAELAVIGNHDSAALGGVDISTFNPNARDAILWHRERMEDWVNRYLKTLPLVAGRDGVTLVHANPKQPEEWEYIFSLWEAEINFSYFEGTFCFVGHSHQPVIVSMNPDGTVAVVPGEGVVAEEGFRYLINVGSVGQPRDGNPAACFGILDTETGRFQLVRQAYEVRITQDKMHSLGLPGHLADRLAEGR